MKNTCLLLILTVFWLIACNKNDNMEVNPVEQTHDTATLVSGKWKILKDSVGNNNYISSSGGYIIPGVYFGTPADYYDFNANGILYVHENGNDASSAYQILQNNKLYVDALSVYPPGDILTLTINKATFSWADTSINGGTYARKLYLIK